MYQRFSEGSQDLCMYCIITVNQSYNCIHVFESFAISLIVKSYIKYIWEFHHNIFNIDKEKSTLMKKYLHLRLNVNVYITYVFYKCVQVSVVIIIQYLTNTCINIL